MKDWTWQIPVAALFVIAIVRIVIAPFLMYRAREKKADETEEAIRSALAQEQAKNARPEVAGEIDEVHAEHALNSHKRPIVYDCFLTVGLRIRNKGAATTIERYKLTLKSGGFSYEASSLSVVDYYRERVELHREGFGTTESMSNEALKDIESDKGNLLTKGQHREGWLRFFVAVPFTDVHDDIYMRNLEEEFEKDAEIIITVVDGYGESHPPIIGKAPFDTLQRIRRIKRPPRYTTHRIEQ
ncbi:MAG TPA: hypothetical protein VGB98_13630 [Pyrinomonadaceae bacterium]|jgi:hypothetical protein